MENLECPHCGKYNLVETDEMYEDDGIYEKTCEHCGEDYMVHASLSWHYNAFKEDGTE